MVTVSETNALIAAKEPVHLGAIAVHAPTTCWLLRDQLDIILLFPEYF